MTPVKEDKKKGKRKLSKEDQLKVGYDLHEDDEISFKYKNVFSTEMYSEEAVKTIQSHDQSSPMFLMVAFQGKI